MTVLHVMFSPSAAGTLHQAVAQQGRDDRIIALHDDFSFGPIDGDLRARARWTEEVLGLADWDCSENISQFLELSRAPDVKPVAWFSRLDTESYAGFLWWLSWLGDAPCSVVDVTDLTVTDKDGKAWLAVSPSTLWQADMLKVIDSHVPLDQGQREQDRALWRALAAENAPLRVIDQGGSLISAPISFFDPLLVTAATSEWRKMARIMAEAMASFLMDDRRQTCSFVLHARIRALAELGALEWRGDLADMPGCELRLPARAGAG